MPTVRNQGIEIHYEMRGSGQPLVLLHSFLCSGEMWSKQVAALSQRARVINIDLRGHGKSGRVEQPCSLEDMLADVVAVLDAEQVESAVWAGLSIGGMIALRAALSMRDRVAGLILLDSDAGAERRLDKMRYAALARLAGSDDLTRLKKPISWRMFGRTTLQTKPDLVEEWSAKFGAVHVESTLHVLNALLARRDLTGSLGGVDVPTQVIVGAEDVSLSPARSRRIAISMPNAEFLELDASGHLSALERPNLVSAHMLRFLERRI